MTRSTERHRSATQKGELRKLGVERDTLVWFNSDNGGYEGHTGGLRGYKGQIREGGVRGPGIVEWPGVIESRRTSISAVTSDTG